MAKHYFLPAKIVAFFLIFSFSCDSSDPPPPPAEISRPSSVTIRDVANAADASDLELTYGLGAPANIQEIRLFVVKLTAAANFDLQAAETSSPDSYLVVDVNTRTIRFAANQLDADGDPLSEGTDYVGFALAVASDQETENKLSEPSDGLALQQLSAVSTLTDFINAGSGGMDADAQGNIFMGDFGPDLNGGGQRVIKITTEGVVSTFANGLNGASGNDFDADGNLFQSSITGGFVSRITPGGSVTTYASDGIVGPVGVAVATDGSLFVANCGNNTIWKVDPAGNTEMFSQSPLLSTCPNGIDLDDQGNVYTALFGNGNIIKITPDGTASVFATIPGGNNGHLLIAGDIMYVIARGAHQIYTVDMSSANVELFAGTGSRGIDNGSLDQATFSFPNDLALSPDGSKIYVNDVDPSAGASNIISPVVIRVIDLVD